MGMTACWFDYMGFFYTGDFSCSDCYLLTSILREDIIAVFHLFSILDTDLFPSSTLNDAEYPASPSRQSKVQSPA